MKKFASVISVAIFCLLIFAGCATKEGIKNISDEDALKDRVNTYWSHRIKGDLEKAYLYEDLYTRKINSLTKYIQINFNPLVKIVSIEILDVERKEEDVATIKFKGRLIVKVPGGKPLERDSIQTEQWMREDGIWYHVSKGK